MIPAFRLLPVTESDYGAVFALHQELFRAHIERIWGWHPDWQKQNFRRNWAACETRLIEVDGRPAGYLQTVQETDHLFLKNLGLLPCYQRLGIGSKLMRDLQCRAADLGLPVRLSVFTTNPDAVRFYERLGFVRADCTSEFQLMHWSAAPTA